MTTSKTARPLFRSRIDSFRGKTFEQKVQELVDREEIRDIVAIYAHRMAQGGTVADLFTDDGAYVNGGLKGSEPWEIRGRAAVDEFYQKQSESPNPPLPMIHNHLISINGDEATGICSLELRITANGESVIASAYYNDKYRRENGQWKFVERETHMFHWAPLLKGWAESAK